LYGRVARFLRQLEIQELGEDPAWYPPGEARFRFVQISDVHYQAGRKHLLEGAGRFINESVKPAFVVFTGDNSGSHEPSRQTGFRKRIESLFEAPVFVLRGDNWARNFVGAFGSYQWRFDCGGIRFIGSGLDVDVENLGIGHFLPETREWLARELKDAAHRPVVYFQHENIQPPTFLDAGKLDRLFESSGNVLMTLTGHLHADVESKTGRVLHVVAPALGPHPRHGFKVVEVYADQLVVRTAEYSGEKYRLVRKFQRVEIPKGLRDAPGGEKIGIWNLRKRAPRDTTFDRDLLARQGEVGVALLAWAARSGKLAELWRALREEKHRPEAPRE
jgi:hypothetical protein